jgi:hypothetical protein
MINAKRIAYALAAPRALAGCSDDMDQLHAQVDEIRSRPGGRIEPLPEVRPVRDLHVRGLEPAFAVRRGHAGLGEPHRPASARTRTVRASSSNSSLSTR